MTDDANAPGGTRFEDCVAEVQLEGKMDGYIEIAALAASLDVRIEVFNRSSEEPATHVFHGMAKRGPIRLSFLDRHYELLKGKDEEGAMTKGEDPVSFYSNRGAGFPDEGGIEDIVGGVDSHADTDDGILATQPRPEFWYGDGARADQCEDDRAGFPDEGDTEDMTIGVDSYGDDGIPATQPRPEWWDEVRADQCEDRDVAESVHDVSPTVTPTVIMDEVRELGTQEGLENGEEGAKDHREWTEDR